MGRALALCGTEDDDVGGIEVDDVGYAGAKYHEHDEWRKGGQEKKPAKKARMIRDMKCFANNRRAKWPNQQLPQRSERESLVGTTTRRITCWHSNEKSTSLSEECPAITKVVVIRGRAGRRQFASITVVVCSECLVEIESRSSLLRLTSSFDGPRSQWEDTTTTRSRSWFVPSAWLWSLVCASK
ncbi:hypothetical protein HPB51_009582 [Rhipicephalus microplus]|uniref:Uncharacterized protein n=1 Tax=Rhipicephalus microplus TaxID=6941 RepID=A0A9J6D4T8_RHIMP|nr:hypothetical protein HPB51_009582 [Rhipicephalus microplus]